MVALEGIPSWVRLTGFWMAALAVLVLSLTPVDHLPPQVMNLWDKAQHALGFAGLTVLGLWAYPDRARWVLVGLLLYGAFIELAQSATGWRHGDVLDLLADAVGVLVGAGLWGTVRPVARPRTP